MSIQHVKPQKGSEIVMQHLKDQIRSGTYLPGAKLPTVVELAESFGVGRSTIREALSALKAMGWVDVRHGGGTYVRKELPDEDGGAGGGGSGGGPGDLFERSESFVELLEVRKFIEVGCATLAAERRTNEDLEELAAIIGRMEQALGDEEASDVADIDFHLRIARASHNALLADMMASMAQRLQESMKDSRRLWFFAERAAAESLLAEHRAIYEAIRDGDPEAASSRMMQHLLKVDRVVQRERPAPDEGSR
ncbi:FadR/GntR family transcriptional regulator [Paenibacillus chartarius]|uniref:FadR/GntR family transcriptional regulator n=1 Tax=Paenibacillus chartarius TaxID=747481 RepID=A0ABV6DES5_9BACL